MNDNELLLNAIKAANGNNPILNTLKPDGVDFIDYKNLGDKVIDGVKVNSAIRLKTLPMSGFVGSRKIFYSKLNLKKIYPLAEQVIIIVSDQANIKELLKCLLEQTGINIDSSTLANNLNTKLDFDNNKCGSILLVANPKSIFIDGELTIKYTSNKYRVLNYVKNRVIVLSEVAILDTITKKSNVIVMPNYYYNDAANFPVDHDIFVELKCLTHLSLNNKKYKAVPNGEPIEISPITFEFGNMPEYFRYVMKQVGSNMERGKTYWEDIETYNFKKVVQVYLKWYTQELIYLRSEDVPNDGREYVTSRFNTLDKLDFFFIGKTVELVDYIKNQYPDSTCTGNCGVNTNFEYVCAFQFNEQPAGSSPLRAGTILPIYWGL